MPIVSDGDLKKLLTVCEGKSFERRRDAAVLRALADWGIRLAELTNRTLRVHVIGKRSRPRAAPFGAMTGQALDRYLRTRSGHPLVGSPKLWVGSKGPLTDSGVAQMLRRRSREAGIKQLHLTNFASYPNAPLAGVGGREGEAMRHFGWRSRQLLNPMGPSKDVGSPRRELDPI